MIFSIVLLVSLSRNKIDVKLSINFMCPQKHESYPASAKAGAAPPKNLGNRESGSAMYAARA